MKFFLFLELNCFLLLHLLNCTELARPFCHKNYVLFPCQINYRFRTDIFFQLQIRFSPISFKPAHIIFCTKSRCYHRHLLLRLVISIQLLYFAVMLVYKQSPNSTEAKASDSSETKTGELRSWCGKTLFLWSAVKKVSGAVIWRMLVSES